MNCLIISGMSGAGKSQAGNVLEDAGYYCVDNMPAPLIPRFIDLFRDSSAKYKKVAFIIDVRGETDYEQLFATLDELRLIGIEIQVLFLDCADNILINRYKATRRRHPLDVDGRGLAAAVEEERRQMEPVRRRADFLIDTTHLTNADLKRNVLNLFAGEDGQKAMIVSINTFGFKNGIPHESDLVFDVRFLKNPYYIPELRELDGREAAVYDYVFGDPMAEPFCQRLLELLLFVMPLYVKEGKASLTISIGCTGGRHRSVSVARWMETHLKEGGWDVVLRHRDAGRQEA